MIVLALEFAIPLSVAPIERLPAAAQGALALSVLVVSTTYQSFSRRFIIAPAKLHPLWWSPWLFVQFFVTAIAAGIRWSSSSTLSHRAFAKQFRDQRVDVEALTLGLGKAGAVVLFAYFFLKLHGVADNDAWGAIGEGFLGVWWVVEMLGFVLLPSLLYAYGARARSATTVRAAAVVTVVGIELNRLNINVHRRLGLHGRPPDHYVPRWTELASRRSVTLGVLAFPRIALGCRSPPGAFRRGGQAPSPRGVT
jgi:Ni/Fe-hydrogenase subunit HybB-like protein